jgi:hypothetical protein
MTHYILENPQVLENKNKMTTLKKAKTAMVRFLVLPIWVGPTTATASLLLCGDSRRVAAAYSVANLAGLPGCCQSVGFNWASFVSRTSTLPLFYPKKSHSEQTQTHKAMRTGGRWAQFADVALCPRNPSSSSAGSDTGRAGKANRSRSHREIRHPLHRPQRKTGSVDKTRRRVGACTDTLR